MCLGLSFNLSRRMNKQLLLVLLCFVCFGLFAQSPKISNIDFDYMNQSITITYFITGSASKYNITPEIFKSNGTKISASSFSGDMVSVTAGSQRKIVWDFRKDGVELENQISVKLTAVSQPEISLSAHLVKSGLFPGWGDYRLRAPYRYWICGAAFYGGLGISSLFASSAVSSYNKYSNSTNPDDASHYYNSALSKRGTALIFLGTSVAIWSLDMFFVAKRVKKIKSSPASFPSNYYTSNLNSLVAYSPQKYVNTKAPVQPPFLVVNKLEFSDFDNNKCINSNEETAIEFTINNIGKGDATNVSVNIVLDKPIAGLDFDSEKLIGNILKGNLVNVHIPVRGTMNLATSDALFKISIKEANGFDADPIEIMIPTREFVSPKVEITDYVFTTESGGAAKLGIPINLKVIVQNTGQGIAKDVSIYFNFPENVFKTNSNDFPIGDLKPNESKEINFEFFANKQYKAETIPVSAKLTESWEKYAVNKTMEVNINQELNKTLVKLVADEQQKTEISIKTLTSEVDKNIPFNPVKNKNRYALIIGNEDYSSRQMGLSAEVDVAFAANDARIFKEYAVNTLGVEEQNCYLLTNATAGEMSQKIELVSQILSKLGENGELIFYYAGHGFPDEITKIPYLIPVDVNANNLQSAIKLTEVYGKFSKTNAKRITVFLDACFTGGGRDQGLLSARSVKIKPKREAISGNMVVFAATSEDQSALPYKDKQHGIFTYFLLKKLQESYGDVTYSELEKYIRDNVSLESLKINAKAQDPQVNVSMDVQDSWGGWKIK